MGKGRRFEKLDDVRGRAMSSNDNESVLCMECFILAKEFTYGAPILAQCWRVPGTRSGSLLEGLERPRTKVYGNGQDFFGHSHICSPKPVRQFYPLWPPEFISVHHALLGNSSTKLKLRQWRSAKSTTAFRIHCLGLGQISNGRLIPGLGRGHLHLRLNLRSHQLESLAPGYVGEEGGLTCSTLVAFFADVSINLIPYWSARSLPSSYITTFLEVRSFLLPTKRRHTLSPAYRSISCIHRRTWSKVSLSVTS
eukprot:Protomagalhaensia_wolfi_Nauph_80__1595@NODE_1985_length_1255_cov_182_723684_g1553_i0_p1_GENE_NODE_1985_length_1255_cov_182_723684_g1553_i0NODE_1985_length_1255_cov_182_723684_g1553_i0_p1_ORF_typecomplete_len252_score5_88_NODE_1985_length_1255_cov_182_723684_g1553_i0120875